MKSLCLLCLMIIFIEFAGHGIAGEANPLIAVQLPSGKTLTAEVAITRDKQMKGLMFRKHLAEDRGMLFIYPQDGIHGIWMKNCLIPLDILWLYRHNRIVYMKEGAPPCRDEPCPTYRPPVKSRYVLEVHEGLAAKEGLGLGSHLVIATSGLTP